MTDTMQRPKPGKADATKRDRNATPGSALRHIVSDLGKNGIFLALIVVVVLFQFLTDGVLLRPQNISNLIVQNGYILILAMGMVMLIVAGHIDLSVGSMAAFIGAVSGVFAVNMGLPWWLAIILSLLVGALAGAWQGFWIAYVDIPSFIVTLAGMLIFRGLALVVLGNSNIGSVPGGVPRDRQRVPHRSCSAEYQVDPVTHGHRDHRDRRAGRDADPRPPRPAELRTGRRTCRLVRQQARARRPSGCCSWRMRSRRSRGCRSP